MSYVFADHLWLDKLSISLAFESSGITITCTVLYAEQFDTLRRGYDCDKSMIESLARCVKWDNSGGKSGSAFLKTKGPSGRQMTSCPLSDCRPDQLSR